MADLATKDAVVQRLRESRPPATDTFTYLTIVEKSLSPAILPDLRQLLEEDAELTSDIGWDLVEMLVRVRGGEACLETIARLGNPREVILKVLEAMEKAAGNGGDDDDADDDNDDEDDKDTASSGSSDQTFVTLAGMLGVLHKRLKVKTPSRFLETTLQSVCAAYNPRSADQTAAVIDLTRSLIQSPNRRPALPTRQSSTTLDTPFRGSDAAKTAPDPEADDGKQPQSQAQTSADGDAEAERMGRLLQAFVATVVEAFVDGNGVGWAARLLEYTFPERVVPGRMTMMRAYREVEELQARDALMGQLAGIASDVGLSKIARDMIQSTTAGTEAKQQQPPPPPQGIEISTDGAVCLVAYETFASEVFDANHKVPEQLRIFPDHHALLGAFLGEESQAQIMSKPGTAEALVALAVYMVGRERIAGDSSGAAKSGGSGGSSGEEGSEYMAYHHLVTLISVFHQDLRVRNAATVVAGHVLHADPDEDDRLGILEDLLENCMFSSLQACAVTWLREEIIGAHQKTKGSSSSSSSSSSRFADPTCLDKLQYSLFPDLTSLVSTDAEALREFWAQNHLFHLQVANFATLLFGGNKDQGPGQGRGYAGMVPPGLAAAVEHRYVAPLQHMVWTLTAGGAVAGDVLDGKGERKGEEMGIDAVMELEVLGDTLGRIPLL